METPTTSNSPEATGVPPPATGSLQSRAEATLKKLFRRDKRLYRYCFRQAVYHFRMTGANPTREQTDVVAAWYADTLIEVLDECAAEEKANNKGSQPAT